VLLAHNPYATEAVIDAGLDPFTPATVVEPDALRRELNEVRVRGWAADVEELVEGEVSVAAPIQDRRGATVGAIGISGPIERLANSEGPRSDLISYVRESARAVSRDLGAIPW
jgi:DNA-binding IclR family transcriptional regulator